MITTSTSVRHEFPEDFIAPEKKNKEWGLKFVRAAWSEWNNSGITCMNRGMYQRPVTGTNDMLGPLYDEIAAYMEGRQDPVQYLPMMGVDTNADESWMHVDTTILPVMPMLVRIVNGILDKSDYDIGFFANDPMAADRKNSHFAKQKAKMMMREEVAKQAQANGLDPDEAIRSLGLEKTSDEAGDMEELEMQMMYTWKDHVSLEWSKAVKSVLSANRGPEIRKSIRKNILYYGVAGTKDYIDTNGSLKCRSVDPNMMMSSWCRRNDFSDARYLGEVLTMSMQDFAQKNQDMPVNELIDVARKFSGKFGNPNTVSTWDAARNFKIQVLDIEWKSTNLMNYEVSETKYGNMAVVRQPVGKGGNNFIRRRYNVIYKAKWILDSDVIWDFGVATDMKRAKEQLSDVDFSYHFYAPMMSEMRVQSIGQMVKPICDQAQWAWLKLQKTIGEYRSKGFSIDFSGTEGIKLGKGGTSDLDERGILDLFLQGNVHVWRSKEVFDPQRTGQRGKPIEVVEGTGMDDILQWMNAVQMYVQMLKSMIVGLNDYTDASTPDARSLGATVNTAVQSTNNSLHDIVESDIHLLGRLSESIVIRLQDMVQFGLVDRLSLSIGDNSVQFFKDNPMLSPADWNIEVRPLPTDQERQQLTEEVKAYVGAGMIEFEDGVMIRSMTDLREAEQVIAWKIKRRKEAKIQESLMLQQQNAQVQSQSAIAVEQERQKTIELENAAKIEVANIQAGAAIEVAKIQAGAATLSKAMSYEDAKMKEEEAMAAETESV